MGNPCQPRPGVNTEEDEDAPFFHAPTNVLYFSSTGHDGMGGFDIFYSPRNANGEFVASKNMGYPINSADDDLYFSPSADHDRGYYASIRWNQEGKAPSYDIYEVEFEQRAEHHGNSCLQRQGRRPLRRAHLHHIRRQHHRCLPPKQQGW